MKDLVDKLKKEGYLKSLSVEEAFLEVDRSLFIPDDLASSAYLDIPLPIGNSQTISQPLTVAFMLEKLDLSKGHNVLDVGSGSCWTTALIAHIVGEKGRVVGLEYNEDIFEFGKKNISNFDFLRKGIVEVYCADGRKGFSKYEPYDRILVSAMSDDIPIELKKQLRVGGKMVIPMQDSIFILEKKDSDKFEKHKFYGFAFVPLLGKN